MLIQQMAKAKSLAHALLPFYGCSNRQLDCEFSNRRTGWSKRQHLSARGAKNIGTERRKTMAADERLRRSSAAMGLDVDVVKRAAFSNTTLRVTSSGTPAKSFDHLARMRPGRVRMRKIRGPHVVVGAKEPIRGGPTGSSWKVANICRRMVIARVHLQARVHRTPENLS